MVDQISQALWEIGLNSPDARKTIAKIISNSSGATGYSIPTRHYNENTEEAEDIHTSVFTNGDPDHTGKLAGVVRIADTYTIGGLSNLLNMLRIALVEKEAQGEELTPKEKTFKDLDITLLALHIVDTACEYLKPTIEDSQK